MRVTVKVGSTSVEVDDGEGEGGRVEEEEICDPKTGSAGAQVRRREGGWNRPREMPSRWWLHS